MSKAQYERLAIIQPLLDERQCICDKVIRREIAAKVAQIHHTSIRRVLRLYYRYLATGVLVAGKPSRKPTKNETYDWAIRTFYYSSKRLSLRAAYEMMLVERFTEVNGKLSADAPSWSGFQHYFYKHGYHKKPQKIIAREGLSHYQRNYRQLHGSCITCWSSGHTYSASWKTAGWSSATTVWNAASSRLLWAGRTGCLQIRRQVHDPAQ